MGGKRQMNLDPNDEPHPPPKPRRDECISDREYMKKKIEYITARNRYLKELKKRDAHVKEVDESINKMKENKQYRKQKDSTWKAEQLNNKPQSSILKFARDKKK